MTVSAKHLRSDRKNAVVDLRLNGGKLLAVLTQPGHDEILALLAGRRVADVDLIAGVKLRQLRRFAGCGLGFGSGLGSGSGFGSGSGLGSGLGVGTEPVPPSTQKLSVSSLMLAGTPPF